MRARQVLLRQCRTAEAAAEYKGGPKASDWEERVGVVELYRTGMFRSQQAAVSFLNYYHRCAEFAAAAVGINCVREWLGPKERRDVRRINQPR